MGLYQQELACKGQVMSQSKQTAKANGDGLTLGMFPDARVAIDLWRVSDGWSAFNPSISGMIGCVETVSCMAKGYCQTMAEHCETREGR